MQNFHAANKQISGICICIIMSTLLFKIHKDFYLEMHINFHEQGYA